MAELGRWLLTAAAWLKRGAPTGHAPAAISLENLTDALPKAKGLQRWLSAKARFYAISGACHVLGILLLAGISFALRVPPRPAQDKPIDNEIAEPVESPEITFAPDTPLQISRGSFVEYDPAQLPTLASSKNASTETGPAPAVEVKPILNPANAAAEARPNDALVESADSSESQKAIFAALGWLGRHQNPSGSWSLQAFQQRCEAEACGGAGVIKADAAATALAILPFLGMGNTQSVSNPYRETVARGLTWLMQNQRPNGDLSAGGEYRMYCHALATLALCEDYALTQDAPVGAAAQAAVKFLEAAQNRASGGWHYEPGGVGNTSVVVWQVLALRSAQTAGFAVDPRCLAGIGKWFHSVSQGQAGGLFCYEPGRPVTLTMTAAGLLSGQLGGAPRDDPAALEGRRYLLEHPPNAVFTRDVFYWYFAMPALRHLDGPEWRPWYEHLRGNLLETQAKTGCAAGSWFMAERASEVWSQHAGRLMSTSLAAQLLELEHGRTVLHAPQPRLPIQAAAPGKNRFENNVRR